MPLNSGVRPFSQWQANCDNLAIVDSPVSGGCRKPLSSGVCYIFIPAKGREWVCCGMDEISGKHQVGSCGGAGAAFDAMDPDEKVALVRALRWPLSASAGAPSCSATPGRPVRPSLVEPKNLPRRRALTTKAMSAGMWPWAAAGFATSVHNAGWSRTVPS